MVGTSIILLLACGGILSQGSLMSNGNLNTHRNIFSRRNSNANSNSNVFNGSSSPSLPPRRDDDSHIDSSVPFDHLRRNNDDETAKTSSVAAAAAEAAVTIAKSMIDELSESMGVAVGEAVSLILTDQATKTRRSYNANSNTNIVGLDNGKNRPIAKESNGMGKIYDLPRGSGGSPHGYYPNIREINQPREMSGSYYDNDEEQGEMTTKIWLITDEDNEDSKEDLASKSLSRRGWDDINNQVNVNSNTNSNRDNFRRNSSKFNDNYLDDSIEDPDEKRMRVHRSRTNINSNTNLNSFRRDINSNSNYNSLRRAINSNSNNNRIHRGYKGRYN